MGILDLLHLPTTVANLAAAITRTEAKVETAIDRSDRAEANAASAQGFAENAQRAAGEAAAVSADARSVARGVDVKLGAALEVSSERFAALEARLIVLEGDDPPPLPPPSDPGTFTWRDATHKIAPLIDPNFDASRPTLRDGTALTGDAKVYYEASVRAFLRDDAIIHTNYRAALGNPDSYIKGRNGEIVQVPATRLLARTGDSRFLDALTVGWNIAYDQLRVTWDATLVNLASKDYVQNDAGARIIDDKWVLSNGKTPWSPHPKWLYHGVQGIGGAGTDVNNLQNIKPWGVLVEYLWVLHVNRDALSNAGFDYGQELDKWRPVIAGFIRAFSEDTNEPWADNYEGLDGDMLWGSSRTRAKWGTWPIFVRGEGHAIYNSALFTFYAGLLGKYAGWTEVPNPERALVAADELMAYIRGQMVPTRDSKGQPSLIFTGGAAAIAMKATYTGYTAWEWAHIQDIGRWQDLFDDETMLRLSRSFRDMIQPDGSTLKNIAAEVDRTGHGLDVSQGSSRTPLQNAINGFSLPLIWGEDEYLFDTATAAQTTVGGYGDLVKSHILPAAQFLRLAGPLA